MHLLKAHKCNHCKQFFACFDRYQKHCIRHSANKTHAPYISHFQSVAPVRKPSILQPEKDFKLVNRSCQRSQRNRKRSGQRHRKGSTDIKADGAEQDYKCIQCVKSFVEKRYLVRHLRTVHNEEKQFLCTVCGKRFAYQKLLKSHAPVHSDVLRYRCDQCGRCFRMSHNLRKHTKTHTKSFLCTECGKRFANEKGLTKHELRHAKRPNVELSNRTAYFPCDLCGKWLKTKRQLAEHVRTHTGETPYQCHRCGMCFRINSLLVSHMIKSHSENKPFTCNVCEKRYTDRSNLHRHKKTHQNEKGDPTSIKPRPFTFLCDECGESYTKKCSLTLHKRKHAIKKGEKIPEMRKRKSVKFPCDTCGKRYSSYSNLQRHVAQLHMTKKRVQCSVCGKFYKNEQVLRQHSIIHTVYHIQCTECCKVFARKFNLKKHMETVHPTVIINTNN